MSSTLKPVDAKEIDPQLDCTSGVTDGGAFMNHQATTLLEVLDDWSRGVSCRFKDPYAFLDGCADVGSMIRRIYCGKESYVDPKGLRGFLTAFADFLSKMVWRCLRQGC